jgi:DNA-binding transcriptional LysR family regulator
MGHYSQWGMGSMLGAGPNLQKRTIQFMMTRKSDRSEDELAGPGRLRFSLRQLEVFVATARAGSTRAAAERVARSQSAASATLTALEAALGAPLFDRVRQRLVLNENGRALLAKAAALLDRAAELQQLFGGPHATTLRVAASLTIGEVLLPELVARWKASHPASPVQITIGNTSEVIAAVAGFDVDLGFIEGPQTHPELLLRPWLTDEMVVVAAATHPLARQRRVDAAVLRTAPWAVREAGSGTRETVDRWLLEHLGPVEVGFEFGSTEAIKRLVATGAALGCLSRLAVVDALDAGTLVELRTGLPPAKRRLAIVTHRDKHLGRGTEDFLRHCTAAQRAKPAR